ncbi:hypothetical protein NPD7_2222 [Clostridium sporogenes]|nr:hypothetical protein NPD7_2222 [Clostridium sporogenes]
MRFFVILLTVLKLLLLATDTVKRTTNNGKNLSKEMDRDRLFYNGRRIVVELNRIACIGIKMIQSE